MPELVRYKYSYGHQETCNCQMVTDEDGEWVKLANYQKVKETISEIADEIVGQINQISLSRVALNRCAQQLHTLL